MRRVPTFFALLLLTSAAIAQTARVGVTTRVFHPAATRNWRGPARHELRATIWYPAVDTAVEVAQLIGPPDSPSFFAGSASPRAEWKPALSKFPLVLLSHGTGGSALQLAWLGTALAREGYIAAAVDHPGNNGTEPYTAEGFVLWWERATDLSEVLDGLLADPDLAAHIDAARVGAAGFSLGGYTVLQLAGARTDISALYEFCHAHADAATCHVPEMRDMGSSEQMLAQVRKSSGASLALSAESYRDPRIRAVYAIAPAVAFTQTQDSLREIRTPVELVVGAADPIAPPRENADYLRANIHGARENVLPGGVSHYTFLDTCAPAVRKSGLVYCQDAPGVDRDAVHAQVAAMAVTFFNHSLRVGKTK